MKKRKQKKRSKLEDGAGSWFRRAGERSRSEEKWTSGDLSNQDVRRVREKRAVQIDVNVQQLFPLYTLHPTDLMGPLGHMPATRNERQESG